MSDDWPGRRPMPEGFDSVYKRPLTHRKRGPNGVGTAQLMWALWVVKDYNHARRFGYTADFPPEPKEWAQRARRGGYNFRRP
jgi:hypothetical protein